MIGIQILAFIFALFMMYLTLLHYRRREFRRGELYGWYALWFGLVVIVLFPHLLDFALRAFRITRTFDVIVIISTAIVFGLLFRNYVVTNRLQRTVEEFTRALALRDAGVPTKPGPDDERRAP